MDTFAFAPVAPNVTVDTVMNKVVELRDGRKAWIYNVLEGNTVKAHDTATDERIYFPIADIVAVEYIVK